MTLSMALPFATRLTITGLGAFGLGFATQNIFYKRTTSLYPCANPILEERGKELVNKMGIAEDVIFLEAENSSDYTASAYPLNKSVIVLSKDSSDALIAHELIHVKNRHLFKRCLASSAATALCVGLSPLIPLNTLAPLIVATNLAVLHLLGRNQEKEADIEGCKYVSTDAIASYIHYIDHTHFMNYMTTNYIRANHLFFPWVKVQITELLFSIHPPPEERIDYLKHIFYQKVTNSSLPIIIEKAAQTRIDLSLSETSQLREMVRKSKREVILINFKNITLKPDADNDNVIFGFENSPTTDSKSQKFTVNSSKINAYINAGKPFYILQEVVEECLNSRSYYHFTLNHNKPREESIKVLKQMLPKGDFENIETENGDPLIIRIYEKT